MRGAAKVTLRLVLATLILSGLPALTSAQDPLQVGVFRGSFNLPIWAAQEKGFFRKHRVEVKLAYAPSAVSQLTSLVEGKFDVAMTPIDNVIAYQEGQSEAEVTGAPDLFAFMGADNGFLRLVVTAEIESYADLKSKELSTDAISTGYAFVLRKMLERGGLKDGDYTLVQTSNVLGQWEGLTGGKQAGALLTTPFEIIAESAGFRRLGNAMDVLGRYQGLVGATRRSWARAHSDRLVGYIRAYLAGLSWLFDRANKAEALAILQKHLVMTPELAAKTYEALLHPAQGFSPRAELDVDGVRTVLRLRSEYGRPQKTLQDPAKYYDPSYYRKATSGR